VQNLRMEGSFKLELQRTHGSGGELLGKFTFEQGFKRSISKSPESARRRVNVRFRLADERGMRKDVKRSKLRIRSGLREYVRKQVFRKPGIIHGATVSGAQIEELRR